jgi:DNA excision repair protein ERCC-2
MVFGVSSSELKIMNADLKLIPVSVRDFALPVPRTGSIEAHSGYGRAAAEGQEIHARVQKKRVKSDQSYEAEVAISREFIRQGYRFRIDGRMDGIFRSAPLKIEEIKTGFNIRELARSLSRNTLDHPYLLQLATYGYFTWLEHKVVPALSFHLVSTRNRDSLDLDITLDLPAYEQWLDRRLDELVEEAGKAGKRALRRRKLAASLSFPYEAPRFGQIELMQTIEQGMRERKPMLIQAPTGLGKTVGVLYPVLTEALSRGQRVVYVTPKNSQHLVAEDAVMRFQDAGSKIKSLTITAKGKICFQNEPLCDPAFCEYARDYYAKAAEHGLLDILSKKRKLTARTFRDLGKEYEVCPYELQLDGAEEADLVICDYNYVFAPRSAFGRTAMITVDQTGKPNLVIDEAHNLPSRAMEYYSPSLSSMTLESMRGEAQRVPFRFREEAGELLDSCIRVVASCRTEENSKPTKIDPPIDSFLERDTKLRTFLSRYLDSDIELQPRDVVMRLCFYWSAFAEALEYIDDPEAEEFFTTFSPHPAGGIVKITCCDASAMLKGRYDAYEQVVGFSATLKPFDYYAGLSGIDPGTVKTAEFHSPFPGEHRKLLVIPQISTKYSDRERNYAKIAEVIARIAALRPGNYFAFFPSFEFLERTLALFQVPEGFAVLKQERDMTAARVGDVMEQLREGPVTTILFAVQGGMFSEGVDYPGEMAVGAFVIGPPLPNFDLERELMRGYYQKKYQAGFDYAYAIPAMAKAIQAAGRVIRSGTDRGLIVLMDNRFVQPAYSRSMPADWFESDVSELVSDSILKEVSEFWKRSFA